MPQPAPSPDTKFNANSSAKKSGNGWAKVLIGTITIVACAAITVFSAGTAAPVMTPLAAWGLAFATGVATGITFSYGNNLMHQIDQTNSFKQASDNAAKATTKALPFILGGSAFFAGGVAYTSTLTGGQLPSLGLKFTPFAASAFDDFADDVVDDATGIYRGQQTTGATQSGNAGTTACTETGQVAGEGIKFSNKLSVEQWLKQVSSRGWNEEMLANTINNPYTTRTALNRYGSSAGSPATAYYNQSGSYVVVDDISGKIIQVSDFFNPNWIPDASIINPFKP